MRAALDKLGRYIVTSEVAKHRVFMFLEWPKSLVDGSVIAVALDDASWLAIMSSAIHTTWSKRLGGRMGAGNDLRYNNSLIFWPFPFPSLSDGELKSRLRDLGERLDAHRKSRQAAHPDLTLTGMYNVLEKLRTGEPLTAKDKTIHDQGLVTLLKQIHDEIDRAVLDAYGWLDLLESNGPTSPYVALRAMKGREDEKAQVSDCGGKRERDTALGDEPPSSPSHPPITPDHIPPSTSNLQSSMLNVQSSMFDVPSPLHPSSARLSSPNALNLHPLPLADRLARPGPDSDSLSQSLLTRLVALNHQRAAEEKSGHIRWLRPDYQCATGVPPVDAGGTLQQASQVELLLPPPTSSFIPQPSSFAPEWPKALPEQVLAIRHLLPAHGPNPAALSALFGRKSAKRETQIRSILATLEALGRV
jgi:hypothetical protein